MSNTANSNIPIGSSDPIGDVSADASISSGNTDVAIVSRKKDATFNIGDYTVDTTYYRGSCNYVSIEFKNWIINPRGENSEYFYKLLRSIYHSKYCMTSKLRQWSTSFESAQNYCIPLDEIYLELSCYTGYFTDIDKKYCDVIVDCLKTNHYNYFHREMIIACLRYQYSSLKLFKKLRKEYVKLLTWGDRDESAEDADADELLESTKREVKPYFNRVGKMYRRMIDKHHEVKSRAASVIQRVWKKYRDTVEEKKFVLTFYGELYKELDKLSNFDEFYDGLPVGLTNPVPTFHIEGNNGTMICYTCKRKINSNYKHCWFCDSYSMDESVLNKL